MAIGNRSNGDSGTAEGWTLIEEHLRLVGAFQPAKDIMLATELTAEDTISTLDRMYKYGVVLKRFCAQVVPVVVGVDELPAPTVGVSSKLDDIFAKTGVVQVDYASVEASYGLSELFASSPELFRSSGFVDVSTPTTD